MIKKCIAILSMAAMLSMPTITAMADYVDSDDATGYTQQVVSQNIVGAAIGNASIIPDDDPLLDGHFSNGELANGFICYNKPEAEEALIADIDLQNTPYNDDNGSEDTELENETRVYPVTDRFVGIDNDGDFFYTIHSSGSGSGRYSAKSDITVVTQANLYNDSSDESYVDSNQSYIVTLVGPSGTVGSYRGYTDDINGGRTFSVSQGVGVYNIRITVNGLSRDIYLNGSGNADL